MVPLRWVTPVETPQPPIAQNLAKDPVQNFTLMDSRTLAYARYGASSDSNTPPVFYFNGTPGSHLECQLLNKSALNLGIPLIATDRPGFGSSSWQEKRTLLQWPQDILELADHLGIDRFGVLGLSGGGPYVLACLHELPRERLITATVISGMYPLTFGTTGMMWQTRMLFWLAGISTWIAEKMIDLSMGRMLRNTDTQKLIKQIEGQAATLPQPKADKECMKEILEDDILSGAYIGSMKEALRTSSKGAAWEFWLLGSDWGFKVENLDASRLTIWHGGLDVNVPVGMPDKAVELLPNVEYKRLDSDGHLSLIVRHNNEILSHLLKKF
ncbi:alpha/beta-hydrolase [Lophium mytilinum]|uniref:Alpha/beta-hydrolase n=1 Tax=Lophium mytilinum TaxID=390894 RepID=A0A6A6R7Q0_9PEZI|nr:alpha/beta-hydrolase [Lophium mytilinum]